MNQRLGFTLIELMVAILIIGILCALIMPAVASSREAARRTQCLCNLKQLALAAANYESIHGVFPYGVGGSAPPGSGRVPRWSAHSQLLFAIDQAPLFNAINFSGVAWMSDPVYGPPNQTAMATKIAGFLSRPTRITVRTRMTWDTTATEEMRARSPTIWPPTRRMAQAATTECSGFRAPCGSRT